MGYIETIQRGIDHVEARLDDEISFREIGRAAGMSPWHFQRMFKALTNETLKGYIRSRRLARACASLVGGRERILDIALAAGYDTQESFSRAFKRHHGLTPGEFRRAGKLRFDHKKACIDAAYLAHLHTGVDLAPLLHTVPARTCVGLKTRFFGAVSEKNNVAQRLPPLWRRFLERLPEVAHRRPGACYGILFQEDSDDAEQLSYFAAVEVDEAADVPEGMTVMRLEAQTYARFRHVGAVDRLDHTVNYIYSNWLLHAGWRHTEAPDIETYGDEYDPASENCVTYYSVPVCKAPSLAEHHTRP